MRWMRGRGWMIDVFLWVCPLAGVAVFVAVFLAGKAPRPTDNWDNSLYFDVPGGGAFALLGCTFLLPLIVACAAGRALGFLAVTLLLILLATAAAYLRSGVVSDTASFNRVEEKGIQPSADVWVLHSQGRGISLFHYHYETQRDLRGYRRLWISSGRDRCIYYGVEEADQRYPTDHYAFDAIPKWLLHIGFAATKEPQHNNYPKGQGITFAIALPYWFLCFLAAPAPLMWSIRQRRRGRLARRIAAGACVNCGYDLRATPDATGARLAICPECGVAAAKAD